MVTEMSIFSVVLVQVEEGGFRILVCRRFSFITVGLCRSGKEKKVEFVKYMEVTVRSDMV